MFITIEKDYTYRGVQSYYQIFIDRRRKGDSIEVGRLLDLKKVLNNRLDDSCVKVSCPLVRSIEASDSKQSPEIQIVDILLGAVGYAWEGFQTSAAKCELIAYVEELLGLSLKKATPYLADKINIWQFRLQNKQKKRPST